MYRIPILITSFVRTNFFPDLFRIINKINPEKLYLFSDGPRNSLEEKKIKKARDFLISQINISGKVYKYFSSENIGPRYFERKALEFALEKEPYVIYLEDDILPTLDFFKFQEGVLPRYENNENILGVSGYNFGYEPEIRESYFLSRIAWNWGIAFYKRILKYYDPDVKDYLLIRKKDWYKRRFIDKKVYYYFDIHLKQIALGKHHSPDWQIYYSAFRYDKYFIVSKEKLVENLGFNSGYSTWFFTYSSPTKSLGKIIHPKKLLFNPKIEQEYYNKIFKGSWLRLLAVKIYKESPFLLKKIINLLVRSIWKIKRLLKF